MPPVLRQGAALTASFSLVACLATMPTSVSADQPAVLIDPDETCVASLASFASDVLGGKVTLTRLAFTRSDELWLSRAPQFDERGLLRDGNRIESATLLNLVRDGQGRCIVIHGGSARRHVLENCRCEFYKAAKN